MQMFVLLIGAIVVTILGLDAIGGWNELRRGRRARALRACGSASSIPTFPWTGHPVRRADPRRLVLVHGPVHRPAGAGGQGPARRAAVPFFAGFVKQLPLFIFVVPGIIAYALAESGQLRAREPGPGADRPHRLAAARGTSRRRDRGPARGAHELAVVGLQLQRHARDDGPLQALAAGHDRAAARRDRAVGDDRCWCCSGSRGSRS